MIDLGPQGLYEEIDDARPLARDSCTSYATENIDYLTKARPNCRVVAEYLIKVIENNKLKLSFKIGLIIRLAKGAGINPLIINLSLITPNIANYLI